MKCFRKQFTRRTNDSINNSGDGNGDDDHDDRLWEVNKQINKPTYVLKYSLITVRCCGKLPLASYKQPWIILPWPDITCAYIKNDEVRSFEA